MVRQFKSLCLIAMAGCWCLVVEGQDYRINGSLIYGVPVYGTFFQDGFESRVGGRLSAVNYRTDELVLGATLESVKFLPYIDNPISITEANFYALTLHLGYDLTGEGDTRLEPFTETGYFLFRYNNGAFTGQTFGLSLGADYVYFIEGNYGLCFGVKWTAVFDKFGRALNPNDVRHLQMFMLNLGVVFDL